MTIPPEQQEVAGFLTKLAGAPAHETHISAVFVGRDTVWKLKKAVRLPFLDFTTIAARRHFLRRELELNTPHAPGIYRDVVPVGRRADGSLALEEGEPVDWLLRMAPIPPENFLDAIAARGGMTSALLDRLGDSLAACHARLSPVRPWDSAGRQVQIARGNAESARAAGLPEARIDAWLARVLCVAGTLGRWLQQRVADGFVRRCHGDLHLGNLCLWEGAPVPFDALEFNEDMATIDTGYDLAFLLMDLDLQVGRAAANRVMNRYVARTGDNAMVAGLPLFLSQRAMIRAHVLAATGQHGRGMALLDAAIGYLAPRAGRVVAIGGLQGAGKSTLARALAPELGRAPGALVVRSDEIRKRLFGVAPEERLPANAYAEAVNTRVNECLVQAVCEAARGGHSVIADSTFLSPAMREALDKGLAELGKDCIRVWLTAPLPVLEDRIRRRRDDASDATVGVLRKAAETAATPAGWTEIDTDNADEALGAVRRLAGLAC